MNKEEIEKYVKDWMDGHEPDTFIQNEHGVYLYSAGPVSINLKLFFESLLEDFVVDRGQYNFRAKIWSIIVKLGDRN